MGDPRAKWPVQNAVELFDIATVCLVHIPKRRPGMDQVSYKCGCDLCVCPCCVWGMYCGVCMWYVFIYVV